MNHLYFQDETYCGATEKQADYSEYDHKEELCSTCRKIAENEAANEQQPNFTDSNPYI